MRPPIGATVASVSMLCQCCSDTTWLTKRSAERVSCLSYLHGCSSQQSVLSFGGNHAFGVWAPLRDDFRRPGRLLASHTAWGPRATPALIRALTYAVRMCPSTRYRSAGSL